MPLPRPWEKEKGERNPPSKHGEGLILARASADENFFSSPRADLFNKRGRNARRSYFSFHPTRAQILPFSLPKVDRCQEHSLNLQRVLVFRYRGALLPDLLDTAGRILFAARCIGFRQIFSFV